MQKIILLFHLAFLLIAPKSEIFSQNKILFVVSNQQTYGKSSLKTSNHFGEIVYAYDVFVKAGYKVDFVSPKGGSITFGYLNNANPIQKKYLNDTKFLNKLKNTLSPEKVKASNYKALYYVGGGAAMFGVPENKSIQKIAIKVYEENNGVISAVCHGTAGIVNLKTKDGEYLYKGKEISGYPDIFENISSEKYKTFPFSIEKKINKQGGNFTYSNKRRDNYSVIDGRLVTGQDPSASASVAQKVIKLLQKEKVAQSVKESAHLLLKDDRFNAVSIAVYSKGISHINHFGELDKGKDNTPTNKTLYEIASVTKTMTGYLVAKAIVENKIKLFDPISKYLGASYSNLSFKETAITIQHLLTHTSGLPLNVKGVSELYTNSTKNSYQRAQKLLTKYRKDSLLSDLKKIKVKKLPGKEYSYSNVAPNILAYILEIVYNKPFEALLEEQLFEPADMKNSMVNLSRKMRKQLANGYNNKGELMPNFKEPIQLWGAAGRIKSNAKDLLNYIKFQLQKENPIIKESHTKLFKDTDTIWIGYFWEILDDNDGVHIEHHGGLYGSQNWLLIYPKYNFGISIITNSSFPEANQIIKKTALNIFEGLKNKY